MPETAAPAPPLYQCRHIFPTGNRCGSRALRKEYFCFYHHSSRPPVHNIRKNFNGPFDDPAAHHLPAPEDRTAVLQGIAQVIDRLAANTLDPRRAGLLLYAFQICASILPKPVKDAEPLVTVDEVILDPIHGPIAPEVEVHIPQTLKQMMEAAARQSRDEEARRTPEEIAARQVADAAAEKQHRALNPHLFLIPTLQAVAGTQPVFTPRSRHKPLRLNTLHTFGGVGVATLRRMVTPKWASAQFGFLSAGAEAGVVRLN